MTHVRLAKLTRVNQIDIELGRVLEGCIKDKSMTFDIRAAKSFFQIVNSMNLVSLSIKQ